MPEAILAAVSLTMLVGVLIFGASTRWYLRVAAAYRIGGVTAGDRVKARKPWYVRATERVTGRG